MTRNEPAIVAWASANAAIEAHARSRRPAPDRPVIAIGGPVGAGKSALARRLGGAILSTDDYLPDYDAVPYDERDRPERSDIPLLLEHLAALRAGLPVDVPVWSFQSHRREGLRHLDPAPHIIIEGIHALHEPIARAADLRVFVDAPASIRWARWEVLERTGQRGWGTEVARSFFDSVAEPTFDAARRTYLARADLIVSNDAGLPGD